MKINNFKIKNWWGLLIVCGFLFVALGLVLDVDLFNIGHLVGAGIGMIIAGFSYYCSIHNLVERNFNSVIQYPVAKHNAFTIIGFCVGILISVAFITRILIAVW